MPRVSIGLPVYNGENFIRDAIDSILAQSYDDFELIISDNASTDRTREICEEYAAHDRRIRYYRNSENLGAAKNFNRTFELSTGEYFKWAAHDDIIAPTFIEKCVEVLDSDSSVVLCHSKTEFIDESGRLISVSTERLAFGARRPHERFREMALLKHGCFQAFGVMRTTTLRQTPGIGRYTASDRVLLAELALHGRFFEVPEHLFARRNHAGQSIITFRYRDRIAWFDPSQVGKLRLETWSCLGKHFEAIMRPPLRWCDRLRCFLSMARLAGQMWRGLVLDFYLAGRQLLSGRKPVIQ